MSVETFEGRILSVVAISSTSFELDLLADRGRSQRVRVTSVPPALRAGQLVTASGAIDPNGVLVATTLVRVSRKRTFGWRIPAGVAVAGLLAAAGWWFLFPAEPPVADYTVKYATDQTNLCRVNPGPTPDVVQLACTFDGSGSHAATPEGTIARWEWTYRLAGAEAHHVVTDPVTTLPMDCATLRGAPPQESGGTQYVEMRVELRVADDAGHISTPYDLGPVLLIPQRTCGYAF